jgi:hypothetical protein
VSVEYILLNYLINNDVLGKNLIAGKVCLKNSIKLQGQLKWFSLLISGDYAIVHRLSIVGDALQVLCHNQKKQKNFYPQLVSPLRSSTN